ncbi:MAG: hypothetical protein A2Y79_13580 [Deltaproteobacteria bacterium RBG_13_43_22]|nr:MAG: hypothetical protein A2Y79_13580 [Deltaproteobacteria bacterium RBG_13_43_22]
MNIPPFIPLKELIKDSYHLHRELSKVYDQMPVTQCLRQARCCSLLPEMTFLEALQVISVMMSWAPSDRVNMIRKIVRNFFCNAAEINPCPFLQGSDCLIYPDRFFGCRAYGLWSRDYYLDLADKNRQGKQVLQQQWKKLGISLPGEVITFQVPYCSQVETDPPVVITDEMLSATSDRIEKLSRDMEPWDREFRENYFSDLSFFLAGLQFGAQEAVRLKFFIVQDMIQKGDRNRLNHLLNQVLDLLNEEAIPCFLI